MTKDTKYTLLAFVSGMAVFALLLLLELEGVDWAGLYRKWFGLVLWTLFIFGALAYKYGRSLRGKCLLLFLLMLVLHVAVLSRYLCSVDKFPNVFFLFFSPLEGGAMAFVLSQWGGGRMNRRNRIDEIRSSETSRDERTR
ncbi:MAG TPA: hypothetical protein VMT20_20065 [Terriglobia bacterium]|nr:hypothetical protein [Terriglobia bacterium]